jgi:hypothetical protein
VTKPGTGKFSVTHIDYPEVTSDITYFFSFKERHQVMYPLQVNSPIFAQNTFGFTRPLRYLLEDVSLPNVSLSGMHLKMLKFVQRTSQ